MILDFTLTCVPPTTSHHSKRIVKVGKWTRLADKPALIAAKDMLDGLLLAHVPLAPLTGPLSLLLEFTWPWRSSDSKRVRARGRIPKTTRPDLSNLCKTIEDRMVALRFLDDDGPVVELISRKFIGPQPGIRVRLKAVQINPLFVAVSA